MTLKSTESKTIETKNTVIKPASQTGARFRETAHMHISNCQSEHHSSRSGIKCDVCPAGGYKCAHPHKKEPCNSAGIPRPPFPLAFYLRVFYIDVCAI